MSKKSIITVLSLLVVTVASLGFYHFNIGTGALGDNLISPPKNYFTTSRAIHAAIISQKDTKVPDLNRRNLNHAAVTLFHNLKNDQNFDRIVVIYDPTYPIDEADPFQYQAKFTFPGAKYSTLRLQPGQTEADIYATLEYSYTANTLLVLHSYLNFSDFDGDLLDVQRQHYKNAFDNISKAALDTIAFSNKEGVKAVYQLAKESDALKALPTLEEAVHEYQIKFLAEGVGQETDKITLTFLGDVMLGRHVRTLMDKNSLNYPFEKLDNAFLQMNDLLIANLEGPIAEKAVATRKSIAFRFLPDIAPLLKKHHFDALSLANNHALDMATGGLADSYRLLSSAGLTAFGHPNQITPQSAARFTLHGQKIAILGLNNTDFKLDKTTVVNSIRELTAAGYRVIPFIHWGNEYQHKPDQTQVDLAHAFVDAGAIAVMGMHPHVVQSVEIYQKAPIFYSLGNAVFDQYFSADTQEGLAVTLTLSPDKMQIYLIPLQLDQSQPRLMLPEEKSSFLKRLLDWWRYDDTTRTQIERGRGTIQL